MKKLSLCFSNYMDNEETVDLLNDVITEFDLLSRNWTHLLIKKYLGEPSFIFTNRWNNNKQTALYYAPRVFQIEESDEFIQEYTQFAIKEKLIKLGHDMECDYNTGRCKNCGFIIGWSRKKVQFTEPEIDYENINCNEMIIKKLLE